MAAETTTEKRTCVDCRGQAPATDTNYTLISAKYGWRLSRKTVNGKPVLEWRCPTCWERHRLNGGR